MRRSTIVAVAALIVLLVAGGWFVLEQRSVSSDTDTRLIEITPGQSVRSIAATLRTAWLIRSADAFVLYAFLRGVSGTLQAGTYSLSPALSLSAIVNGIASGKAVSNETIIVIPEGWNSQEIGLYLEQKGLFPATDWNAAVATADIRSLLPDASFSVVSDKPATANLEGYLFPDTYRVYKRSTPAAIIGRMLANAQAKIGGELEAAMRSQGRTVFDVLTLSSIIEKEVKLEPDRRLAADVFFKRLRDGMPLQADATLTYILHKSSQELTADDLRFDSPYNTYRYRGLPPGPIGNPGLASIHATVFPELNPYYYFLTTPDGATVFSATLEEHNASRAKYLRSDQ